jgi:TfoX/Sxy family transcriptional regulator of competence genes
MPYDPGLAARLSEIVEHRSGFVLKTMFGGIGWLLHGNMCVGVYKDGLIVRVGEEAAALIFREAHVRPMDITGRAMKGWAMVAREGVADAADLRRYVELAIAFVRTLPAKA